MAWPRKFTDEQEAEICNDYISGMSLLTVSKKWNCSDSGLQKLFRRHSVAPRKQGASISRRKVQPEQESDVVRMHVVDRMSAEKIAKIYSCSAPSIRSVLRRNNIFDPIPRSREPHIHERTIKPDQEQNIIDLYRSGLSAPKIAKIVSCSMPPILGVLKRNNIPIDNEYSYRKYPLYEDMFDSIDTEEKAYWLGFIYADGCVNKQGTELSIELGGIDTPHLEKFRDFISPGKPIYTPLRTRSWNGTEKTTRKAIINLWGRKLSLSLRNVGISKERQEPEKLFIAIPDSLFHHCLRGYFDGDGSAGTHTRRIALVGEHRLLKWIETKLDEFVHIGTGRSIYYPKNKKRTVGSLHFNGSNIARVVGKFMYRDATIFMERKKEIVDSWK
jgi:hypothetical protein